MKEIKFKCYDIKRGEVIFFNLESCNKESVAWYENQIKDNPVVQFTGLKDRNGSEIYDGDIIKSTFNSRVGLTETDIYTVQYDRVNPCFVMKSTTKDFEYEYDFVQVDLRVNEVIGNIYENKQLLKETI